MQEINILPGRIRLKNYSLYYNKALSRYINIYIDNLYGVKYSMVSHNTASILVEYDPLKTTYHIIKKNIKNALASAIENKPENIREYDNYYKTLEKRDKSRRNIFIYGAIYLALKVKNSIFGKFALSTNLGVLQAASVVTIVGGYPLIKGLYKKYAKNIPADSDILLTLTALSFTFVRESSKGFLLLTLKAMNDYIKYSADAQCMKLLNQSMNRTSEMAWLTSSSKQAILVNVESLKLNDVIIAHEGEVIPVQGAIVNGSALINTLYYTGQPVISRLGEGSKVHEGMSILSGTLEIIVEKIPAKQVEPNLDKSDMYLHQRVSNFQKLITPLSFGASALSYFITGNFMNALSVLLVLTPSGSSVALSTGQKSYITLLNKHKISLRRPEALEKIVNVNHIIFDKTGTLTDGIMSLVEITSFDKNLPNEEILKICAACESEHYHPISNTLKHTIMDTSQIHNVKDSILIPSKGVKASYDNHIVLVGNKDFMNENNIDIEAALDCYLNYEEKLFTPILVSIDGSLVGMIALADRIRQGSYDLIRRLKQKSSYDLSLLTGDNEYKARNVAQKLGINNVYSNCSFQDKTKIVVANKSTQIIMMLGDGLNDVDAMRAADISVSFAPSSCDQVKVNSDCIIFDENMIRISDLISLSQKSYRNINQSITLSQLYNLVFGGLAFVGCIDVFAAKSINTINSLMVLLLNKRIEYLSPQREYKFQNNNEGHRNIK